jgi:hypothetical protein
VSTDGGQTWTEQDLPTAQFYHVSTDNAFPYNILGAQQDNSTVRLASRGSGRGIGRDDWTSTAGGESGYVVAKPDDPDIVLGGSYGGYLEVQNHRTGTSRNINPWPDNPIGHGAESSVHRLQWTFPIVFSHFDPNVVYTCSQYVLRSTNLGGTWTKISPDLSRNDPSTLGPSGGPITKDNTGVEVYATVFTFPASTRRSLGRLRRRAYPRHPKRWRAMDERHPGGDAQMGAREPDRGFAPRPRHRLRRRG